MTPREREKVVGERGEVSLLRRIASSELEATGPSRENGNNVPTSKRKRRHASPLVRSASSRSVIAQRRQPDPPSATVGAG